MEDMLIFIFNILSDIFLNKCYGKFWVFFFLVLIFFWKRRYYEDKIFDCFIFLYLWLFFWFIGIV